MVLGMLPSKALQNVELAATFHQLPKPEGQTTVGRVEQVAIKRALKNAQLVTSPSRRGVDEITKLKLASPAATLHEPNLVATSSIPLVEPRRHIEGPLRLLFCGRITDQKGLDQTSDLTRRTTQPLHFRIIGNGPEREKLQSTLRPSDTIRIEFLDHVDDVTPHVDWCDAIFMPSREELRPMFVQEAWARGRSGIVSNIPAFVDLAKEGQLAIYSNREDFELTLKSTVLDYAWRAQAFHRAQRGTDRSASWVGHFLEGAM